MSNTTFNHWMMVERYPNLKEEVGGSNPGYEISSLHGKKPTRWSIVSCALALACRLLSKKNPMTNKGYPPLPPFYVDALLNTPVSHWNHS